MKLLFFKLALSLTILPGILQCFSDYPYFHIGQPLTVSLRLNIICNNVIIIIVIYTHSLRMTSSTTSFESRLCPAALGYECSYQDSSSPK